MSNNVPVNRYIYLSIVLGLVVVKVLRTEDPATVQANLAKLGSLRPTTTVSLPVLYFDPHRGQLMKEPSLQSTPVLSFCT